MIKHSLSFLSLARLLLSLLIRASRRTKRLPLYFQPTTEVKDLTGLIALIQDILEIPFKLKVIKI